jgi:hypothetical protein
MSISICVEEASHDAPFLDVSKRYFTTNTDMDVEVLSDSSILVGRDATIFCLLPFGAFG